ncbi:MAG: TetR/AcrR family transcriptional regulator, partial [Myxococcales bacterium]
MDGGGIRRVDPEIVAWCLMGAADFLGMRFVLWGRGSSADEVISTAMDFVRHGLATAERSPATARRKRTDP